MTEITTTDLSKFGAREREMLIELLSAWRAQGLPKDFWDSEVVPMMNTQSGNVFLTNSEYQVCMMNGDKLESFYTCPECGHEGFKDEMGKDNNHGYADECKNYLIDAELI